MTMSTRMLGDDTTQSGETAVITTPSGETITLPMSAVGDIFSGEHRFKGDDDEVEGDLNTLLGDEPITHMGDVFSGDNKAKTPSGKTFGQLLPANASPVAKAALSALRAIPGGLTATRALSPVIISNGMINVAPTRNMVPGANFVETIRRFETQYTGTTRTQQVTTTVAANLTFTFAAPTTAEGGNTTWSPVIFIAVSTQRQYQVANVELGISLTAKNESSQDVNANQWTVLLSDADKSCFFAIIPFTEISSTIYPSIAQANATNNLLVKLYNVPANTNVKVVLPGPDSSQYQFFKDGLGISQPTTKAMNMLKQ